MEEHCFSDYSDLGEVLDYARHAALGLHSSHRGKYVSFLQLAAKDPHTIVDAFREEFIGNTVDQEQYIIALTPYVDYSKGAAQIIFNEHKRFLEQEQLQFPQVMETTLSGLQYLVGSQVIAPREATSSSVKQSSKKLDDIFSINCEGGILKEADKVTPQVLAQMDRDNFYRVREVDGYVIFKKRD